MGTHAKLLHLQQKRKLRIFISNTYYPAKPEGEVVVTTLFLYIFDAVANLELQIVNFFLFLRKVMMAQSHLGN